VAASVSDGGYRLNVAARVTVRMEQARDYAARLRRLASGIKSPKSPLEFVTYYVTSGSDLDWS